MVTIGSDCLEVDPEDVKYHGGYTDMEDDADFYDDVLEVEPHEVNYHGPKESISSYYTKGKWAPKVATRDCKTPTNEISPTLISSPCLNKKDDSSVVTEETDSVNEQKRVTKSLSIEESEMSTPITANDTTKKSFFHGNRWSSAKSKNESTKR